LYHLGGLQMSIISFIFGCQYDKSLSHKHKEMYLKMG